VEVGELIAEVDVTVTREPGSDFEPYQRKSYRDALGALNAGNVPFLVAGAFGLWHHSGLWRGTKDLDVVILPEARDAAVAAMNAAGFRDMFPDEPYDREWIFRSVRDGVIVDLIWRLANKEDDIDPTWFDRAVIGEIFGVPVRVVSAADMCWMKLFVMQLRRCDWPDIINIVRGTRGNLDWDHLLVEVGPHWRLLRALVDIYDWLCPPERHFIPDSFRGRLEELNRRNTDVQDECRRDLLDSRPWLTGPGAGFRPGQPN